MKSSRVLLLPVLLSSLAGCANPLSELSQAPTMSPVGQGLQVDARGIPMEKRAYRGPGEHSIWNERKDLYRDPRATRIGDILTVNVTMNDKAILDNKTDRSRDSQVKLGTDYAADIAKWASKGNFDANVSSQSSSKGSGKIDRAEEVRFSPADQRFAGNACQLRDAHRQCRRNRASDRYRPREHHSV
jgi:flagellar L-ring protein FlgH